MLDRRGEYDCGFEDDEHWTVNYVSNRVPVPEAYEVNHTTSDEAEQILRSSPKPVRSLYLVSEAITADEVIRPYIARLPELRLLRVPSQITSTLRPEMIGGSVKKLAFYGTYDPRYWNNKTVTLAKGATFSGIEALTGDTLCYRSETRFRFDADQFPDLRSLGFTFDAKRQFAATLRNLPNLIAVSAAAFDSIESLADLLPCENLVSLTLSWHKSLETLEGIERFPNLQYLKLGSLTQLRSLDGIEALQRLKFVGVYWSKRVQKVDAMLNLPDLTAVDTIGIDVSQPGWQNLEKEAGARGIPVRLIG